MCRVAGLKGLMVEEQYVYYVCVINILGSRQQLIRQVIQTSKKNPSPRLHTLLSHLMILRYNKVCTLKILGVHSWML